MLQNRKALCLPLCVCVIHIQTQTYTHTWPWQPKINYKLNQRFPKVYAFWHQRQYKAKQNMKLKIKLLFMQKFFRQQSAKPAHSYEAAQVSSCQWLGVLLSLLSTFFVRAVDDFVFNTFWAKLLFTLRLNMLRNLFKIIMF